MTDAQAPRKDVADLLENLAHKIRDDPEWGAGQSPKVESGGLVYPANAIDKLSLGPIDLISDRDAITVTAETRNADANDVRVTLAEDRLFIGLGDGPTAIRKDVHLPALVNEEAAVATFRNGVLDIVLPLRAAKK